MRIDLECKIRYARPSPILYLAFYLYLQGLYTSPTVSNHIYISLLLTFPLSHSRSEVDDCDLTWSPMFPPSSLPLHHQLHLWWMIWHLGWYLHPLLVLSLLSLLFRPIIIAGVSWTRVITHTLWLESLHSCRYRGSWSCSCQDQCSFLLSKAWKYCAMWWKCNHRRVILQMSKDAFWGYLAYVMGSWVDAVVAIIDDVVDVVVNKM